MRRFFYLATPYTKYPEGRKAAFEMACKTAAGFLMQGIPVFSPIAHSHPIAVIGNIDAVDHEFWMRMDEPMMQAARGMIVHTASGWDKSAGVAFEIDWFNKQERPIVYNEPGFESVTAGICLPLL